MAVMEVLFEAVLQRKAWQKKKAQMQANNINNKRMV